MISHGESDYIIKGIPHARRVPVGSKSGQVPSEKYGHTWFDYFKPEVWVDVLEGFLDDRKQAREVSETSSAFNFVKAKL